jgi:hypothetical protein
VESLEGRWLMAGNVTATLNNGRLSIIGDAAANAVAVFEDHSTGMLEVLGLTDVGTMATPGSATTVNGGASAEFSGVNSLKVDLKGGDNSFLLTDATLSGSVRIETGHGNDNVVIGAMPDVNPAALDTTRIPSELIATTFHQVSIGGNLYIDTGAGDDQVIEAGVTITGSDYVDGGRGNNSIFLDVFTDTVDSLPALGVNVGKTLAIQGGRRGSETVGLNTVTSSRAYITGSSGADQVTIQNSNFDKLGVSLGRGDDSLDISDTTTTDDTYLHGGKGDDTLTLSGDTLANLHEHGFETTI